jgi:hypothetical protein
MKQQAKEYYSNIIVLDIDTYNGWRYSSCSKYRKKLKVVGKKLGCEICGRIEEYPQLR